MQFADLLLKMGLESGSLIEDATQQQPALDGASGSFVEQPKQQPLEPISTSSKMANSKI